MDHQDFWNTGYETEIASARERQLEHTLVGVAVQTVDHKGRAFSDFAATQSTVNGPGWFVYGRNTDASVPVSFIVARPDVQPRRFKLYNGPISPGWKTMREAQVVADRMNAGER